MIKHTITDAQKEVILRDCKPFLESIDYDFDQKLYRGMSRVVPSRYNEIGLAIVPGHRVDRRPRDTHIEDHDHMNDVFEQIHGKRFRSGLFTTGDIQVAQSYGTVHLVFPIGDFKFCWSAEYCETAIGLTENDIDTLVSNYYSTDEMKWAIESKNEIMLYCDSCYIINME